MPLIASSAHKHGINDDEMIHAFNNPILVEELDDGFTMFIGSDRSLNLIEVGVIDSAWTNPHPRHARPTEVPEVMTMPRTAQEILDQADALAARFEQHEPVPGETHDAAALRRLREAFVARAAAEKGVVEAVSAARADGHSWASIGAMVGTSGEAARQRYGQAVSA